MNPKTIIEAYLKFVQERLQAKTSWGKIELQTLFAEAKADFPESYHKQLNEVNKIL